MLTVTWAFQWFQVDAGSPNSVNNSDVSLSNQSSHAVIQEQQASGLMQADIQISEAAISGKGVPPQDQHCWNEQPSISAAGACDNSFLQEPHIGEWA